MGFNCTLVFVRQNVCQMELRGFNCILMSSGIFGLLVFVRWNCRALTVH